LAAALVLRVKPGNIQTVQQVYQLDASKNIVALPIDFGPSTDQVYLRLLGTGVRHRTSPNNDGVTLGAANLPVIFSGAQRAFVGEDKINVGPGPHSLAGCAR